jgi:hypothetical protein
MNNINFIKFIIFNKFILINYMADLKKIVMLIVVLINIIIFNFIYRLEKKKMCMF